jgi:hypothetical protein
MAKKQYRKFRVKRDMADDIRMSQQISPETGIDTMQLASSSPPPKLEPLEPAETVEVDTMLGESARGRKVESFETIFPPKTEREREAADMAARIEVQESKKDFLNLEDMRDEARLDLGDVKTGSEKIGKEAKPKKPTAREAKEATQGSAAAAGGVSTEPGRFERVREAGGKLVGDIGTRIDEQRVIDYALKHNTDAGFAATALRTKITDKAQEDSLNAKIDVARYEQKRAEAASRRGSGYSPERIAREYGGYSGKGQVELLEEQQNLERDLNAEVTADINYRKARTVESQVDKKIDNLPKEIARAKKEKRDKDAKSLETDLEEALREKERLNEEIPKLLREKEEAPRKSRVARERLEDVRSERARLEKSYREGYDKYKKEHPSLGQRLATRGEYLRQLGSENLAMGKMKSVTEVLASPVGSKSQAYWEKMFEKGTPGYRSDRTVTDIVSGGGSLKDREDTIAKLTSLRGSGASRMFTLPSRGPSAYAPSMTVNVRGIGVGDISAMGIKVRREGTSLFPGQAAVSQPVLEKSKVMDLDKSYVGQYPGQTSWQKAKTRKSGKYKIEVPTLDKVKVPSLTGRLELGKAAVGIASSKYVKAMTDQTCNCGIKPIKVGIDKMMIRSLKGRKKK